MMKQDSKRRTRRAVSDKHNELGSEALNRSFNSGAVRKSGKPVRKSGK